MESLIWVALATLVIIAGLRIVARVRLGRESDVRPLTDEEIRRLEAGGTIELDTPTDYEEVAEAEERFWGESWDEPDGPFY